MRVSDTRVRFSDAPVRFSAWPPERLQKNDILKKGKCALYFFGCSNKLRHPSLNVDILLTGFQLLPPLAGPPVRFSDHPSIPSCLRMSPAILLNGFCRRSLVRDCTSFSIKCRRWLFYQSDNFGRVISLGKWPIPPCVPVPTSCLRCQLRGEIIIHAYFDVMLSQQSLP